MNDAFITPFSRPQDFEMKDEIKGDVAIYFCSKCKNEKEFNSQTKEECSCGNFVFYKKRTKKSILFIY